MYEWINLIIILKPGFLYFHHSNKFIFLLSDHLLVLVYSARLKYSVGSLPAELKFIFCVWSSHCEPTRQAPEIGRSERKLFGDYFCLKFGLTPDVYRLTILKKEITFQNADCPAESVVRQSSAEGASPLVSSAAREEHAIRLPLQTAFQHCWTAGKYGGWRSTAVSRLVVYRLTHEASHKNVYRPRCTMFAKQGNTQPIKLHNKTVGRRFSWRSEKEREPDSPARQSSSHDQCECTGCTPI